MSSSDSARSALRRRLETELDDASLATEIAETLDDELVTALTNGDAESTPLLSYRAPRIPDAEVTALWVFAFGYRFVDGSTNDGADGVPPRADILPGPVNEDLARQVADFVAHTPVPVIAQWEVADVLQALWVPDVVPVDPDVDDNGTVTYLSTAGVIEKGSRLAAEAGLSIGAAGVLGHADHAVRTIRALDAAGITAAVPESVDLPTEYDAESGQPWTRSRSIYVPLDLRVRAGG